MKSCLGLLTILTCLLEAWGANPTPSDRDFFEQKVRPLLVEHCYSCHSLQSKKSKGGLRVDSREALVKGGDSGAALIPGNPDQSLLIKAIQYRNNETLIMPPKGKLQTKDIAFLEEWIRRGAYYPPADQKVQNAGAIDIEKGRTFWSFQPLVKKEPPGIKLSNWPKKQIDHFLLAEQEKRGLKPSPEANPGQFLRRVYFDLVGLPPTPADYAAFQNPSNADYENLVNRLLDSPQHGERWGRFWLDLARYCDIPESWAETKGHSHLYRDWVVKALNEDVPFDRFVTLQLAADLANAPLADRAALGFMGLSPSYWKELQLPPDIIKTVVAEEWEEYVHTLSSTFLGLNVACARCHDHKHDPITARDYYSLAGIFASTRPADVSLLEEGATKIIVDARQKVSALEADLKKLQTQKPKDQGKIDEAQKQIELIKKSTPDYNHPFAVGIQEASLFVVADGSHKTRLDYKANQPQNLAIHIRGNPNNLGSVVPRQFLSVLSPPASKPFTKGSGRLEFAQSLFNEARGLTARVIVNRIWKHHFGVGIVETPSDFGAQGERPSHPELLDDLAYRFVENGWSMKWLHREIVLSSAYRQQSGPASPLDPNNRFIARMPHKRLEVEAWRDAMLAVAGNLDPAIGGPATELGNPANNRRTIYGTVKRRELNDLLRLHDFPDPVTHSPNRVPTTTPLQQLYTLNSPFLQRQAGLLAQRLKREFPASDSAKITGAYRLLFGREPTPEQRKLGLDFVQTGPAAWQQYAQALLGSNEFLFLD